MFSWKPMFKELAYKLMEFRGNTQVHTNSPAGDEGRWF